jgi:hypothetical protein
MWTTSTLGLDLEADPPPYEQFVGSRFRGIRVTSFPFSLHNQLLKEFEPGTFGFR